MKNHSPILLYILHISEIDPPSKMKGTFFFTVASKNNYIEQHTDDYTNQCSTSRFLCHFFLYSKFLQNISLPPVLPKYSSPSFLKIITKILSSVYSFCLICTLFLLPIRIHTTDTTTSTAARTCDTAIPFENCS